MTAPVIERILDNVVSTLRGITVANGYVLTMVGAARVRSSMDVYNAPFCYVACTSQTSKQKCFGYLDWTATIDVYVSIGEPDDWDETLILAHADIVKAMMTDRMRGLTGVWTELSGGFEKNFDDRSKTFIGKQSFEITYQTSVSDLTTVT